MNVIAFQTKIDGDTIHIDNVDSLIGKEVMVTIVEMPVVEQIPQKKKWRYLGTAQNGTDINIDEINIRDFAYE